ncbi:hypothetical protein DFH08DRAFT_951441 [Mycena albidolilacea]|uniref:Uncharacterized protein n=1 Tax=Mycena albidolilacea TaxID=1033008 RepID=A0AAD7F1F2_9AGAR|nr:hypothetical protein DFH08DRAFT_951441 [Mycena albidolilacea]
MPGEHLNDLHELVLLLRAAETEETTNGSKVNLRNTPARILYIVPLFSATSTRAAPSQFRIGTAQFGRSLDVRAWRGSHPSLREGKGEVVVALAPYWADEIAMGVRPSGTSRISEQSAADDEGRPKIFAGGRHGDSSATCTRADQRCVAARSRPFSLSPRWGFTTWNTFKWLTGASRLLIIQEGSWGWYFSAWPPPANRWIYALADVVHLRMGSSPPFLSDYSAGSRVSWGTIPPFPRSSHKATEAPTEERGCLVSTLRLVSLGSRYGNELKWLVLTLSMAYPV